jgi:fatty-acyl-CoA synthase
VRATTETLTAALERWATRSPSKVALHFEGRDTTYAELATQVERAATALDVKKGERVAWLGYNHPQMIVLLFALARRGGILVPLNWRLTATEHHQILADCSPKQIFSDEDFKQAAGRLTTKPGAPSKNPDDLLIVYTSGTTGEPKGAVLTEAALTWNARNSFHAHDLAESDHVLTSLPMFHVGGLNIQTLPALLAGATVTLHKRFDPGAWLADVAKRKPTLSLLVPAAMHAVISHPAWATADLSSLRLLNTGSMVVPLSLIRAFHERKVPVGQVYGATETAPIATALLREDALRKPGSAGKPVPHCQVKLVDHEIWIKGPAVMRGYWRDGSGLAPDGWFRSGDLGRVDDEGFYWIVGRSKDVIISGGENIHPAELENVLADCPSIAEAAVVGIKDAKWGEAACAVVVRKSGVALLESDVEKLFEGRLARYKHPRRVLFLEALPKNAMGKVQKAELRRLVDSKLHGAQSV